ncbi:MAG: NAD(P)H-dependent oxidoreductase subunit E, partial [Burkholderiales bacterium]|nr:NAD(P)H-dependent oxidoreductase subunit E [Burkholderiales bacterium]
MQVIHFRRPIGHAKGRPVEPAARERVRALVGSAPLVRDRLIEYLHLVQDAEGCLPQPLLAALAEAMRLAPAEVYEVATFYHHFDVLAPGEAPGPSLTVRVCESLSCEMAGAHRLIDALRRTLGDGVRVQPVPCVGHCDGAPVAVVGQRPVRAATATSVGEAVAAAQAPAPAGAAARRSPAPPAASLADARRAGAYELVVALHAGSRTRESVFDELERAGLRGLGGAGFPTGRKWRIVAAENGPRHVVVN